MIQIDKSIINNQDSISNKQLQNLNFFWLGFIIYSFSYSLSGTGYVNYIIFQSFQIIGLGLIFISAIKLIQFKIDNEYLRTIFTAYCFWLLILIVRGIGSLSDYIFLKTFLFDPAYGGMLYVAPLILLFPKKLDFYKKAFDIIFIFCIFYILYDILFLRDLVNSDRTSLRSVGIVETSTDLSFPCGFLLLTFAYQNNKRKLLSIMTILLTLLFSIIRARRGLIIMTSGIIIFSYILYLFTSKSKISIVYLTILIISIGALYTSSIYKVNNRLFGFILDRGSEDTRTGVELYFYADMKTKDWIIGRGINGEYYCPGIEEDAPTDYRNVIETGYLQTILKGGIISLGLLLLITIPAVIKGLFYSKNTLSKAAAIWILLALLSLYPATLNTFTLRYLLVWLAVGICYSKNIRNMSDKSLKEYFLN